MERIIHFSKAFVPAIIISLILCVAGIAGYIMMGFNLGVDFQAGLIQEVQIAPTAFSLTYNGIGNASVSAGRSSMTIVISGAGVSGSQYDFPYSSYPAIGDLVNGLKPIDGLTVVNSAPSDARTAWLIQSSQVNPQLGLTPYVFHYLTPDAKPIPIDEVRASLLSLGTVSVQVMGLPQERHFMIRIEDDKIAGIPGMAQNSSVPAERIITSLESTFGQGGVALTRSDYVGSRFSKQLTNQAGVLLSVTLLLILVYVAFRFKPQYAIGAVLALVHDGIIMVAFVVWTRMEFNTTTIAAVMTILGYSINDTIVIFDRQRENTRIFPDDTYVGVLNRSISDCLGRTIITTATTMCAVLSLYIFTSGTMKDFALLLLVGMTSGVYSTIFVASWFVNLWENRKLKKAKKKLGLKQEEKSAVQKVPPKPAVKTAAPKPAQA
ncbi:MAG: protein translocase subunit SecF [Treponema sp.]|nr:protein translocase subunit SecF [Treponema sp.]